MTGDSGHHVVGTQERNQMFGGRTFGQQRCVAAVGEGVRAVTPQPQGSGHHPHLRVAVRTQRLPTRVIVDRSAVVRVDQAVLPQLRALIDIGHTGHRQRHQLLAEAVVSRVLVQPGRPATSARSRPVRPSQRPATRAQRFRMRCRDRATTYGPRPPGWPSRRTRAAARAGRRSPHRRRATRRRCSAAGRVRSRHRAAERPEPTCRRVPPTATAPATAHRCGRARLHRVWCRGWSTPPSRAATAGPGSRRAGETPRRSPRTVPGSPPTSFSDTSRASR